MSLTSEHIEDRALRFLRYGNVRILKDSSVPFFIHFQVTDEKGAEHDVFRRADKYKGIIWSCTAISSSGGSFSCAMLRSHTEKPKCAHSRACELYLEQLSSPKRKSSPGTSCSKQDWVASNDSPELRI